jgi:hypothetical protein
MLRKPYVWHPIFVHFSVAPKTEEPKGAVGASDRPEKTHQHAHKTPGHRH